jgi:hypothetical protein
MKKIMTMLTIALILLATTIKSQVPTSEPCDSVAQYLASPTNCAVFYQCAGNEAPYHWYIANCPPGLHFNETTNTCDYPSKIEHWCGCDEEN